MTDLTLGITHRVFYLPSNNKIDYLSAKFDKLFDKELIFPEFLVFEVQTLPYYFAFRSQIYA